MAASNEWTDWNLTESGWQEGTSQIDFQKPKEVIRPPDTVLVVRWSEYLSHPMSDLKRFHEEQWRSPDEETVAALLLKFGDAPKHL